MINKALAIISLIFLSGTFFVAAPFAADLNLGDSAIYGAGGNIDLRPNVLFIVDNSQFMTQGAAGTPYDPDVTYSGSYTRNAIYRRLAATGGTINYDDPDSPFIPAAFGGALADLDCDEAESILSQTSYYTGPLLSNGSCRGQTGFYYTGNLLNYITNPPAGDPWAPSTTYPVGSYVQVQHYTTGEVLFYEAVTPGNSGGAGSQPLWGSEAAGATLFDGAGLTWKKAGSVMNMVQDAISLVASAGRDKAKFGLMVFGSNNQGGRLLASADKMGENDTVDDDGIDGDASFANFLSKVESLDDSSVLESANSNQKMNEALWDAKVYFENNYTSASSRFGTDVSSELSALNSTAAPIECPDIQPNFIVVLTMGSAYTSGAHANEIGDQDAAYNVGDVDDAAKRLYSGDVTVDPPTPADPRVHTHIVKLINDEPGSATDLTQSALRRAAVYGHGNYYLAQNSSELAEAILDVMNNIVLTTDTSFVAPVVPTSPENRTYSANRVYLGFFRPKSKEPWYGNLKKFGINSQIEITGKDDAVATNANGEFLSTAKSFWNDITDAGLVEVGGAGEVLLGQATRNIYTYFGAQTALNNIANHFTTNNNAITDGVLGVDSADRDKLINFVRGIDTWDEDGDLNVTEKRKWILGDILHSNPLVVNYNQYTFSTAAEGAFTGSGVDTVCTNNKTMIYVGANDGMLHAFRDCNGSEAWAFIPQDLLGDLKLLPPALHSQYNSSGAHPYFVDGTPAVYTYDDDDDGNIESGDGDKVILLFGLRRGGAAYYALDVTNPENPIFLWRITPNEILRGNTVNTINSYGELGQTWSTPQLGKIKQVISGNDVTKIVAFVGAGYDNRNEDGRSGATERYSDTDVVLPTEDDGNTVSDRVDNDPAGALEAGYVTRSMTDTNDEVTNNPVGRGVYAIEIASLDNNGDPNFSNSGNRVWEFGYVGTSNGNGTGNSDNRKRMKHSIPSDITVADTNFDGYTDRLYVGDTGGQLWRLARHNGGDDGARPTDSPYIETWIGNRIFGANGSGSGGKKFFYRPSITFQKDHSINVYIGSGDREHPLNLNIVDRLYAIFDRGQITSEGIDEAELVNVTENLLQEDDSMANNAQVIADTLSLLTSSSKYGWYIKLDEHSGEKPVSDPLVFNKVAYYTTYAPDLSPPPDNCTPGNLGTARIYGINYLTGEAAHNWNEGNDNDGAIANSRAWGDNVVDGEGEALRRIDRVKTLGKGMPSKPEVPMSPGGEATLYIGTGGGLIRVDPAEGGTIIPIYWMVW